MFAISWSSPVPAFQRKVVYRRSVVRMACGRDTELRTLQHPRHSPAIRAGSRLLRRTSGEARKVGPNAAHRALARLEAEWPGEFLLVTQNVDDLHERAGSKRLIHMHGENTKGWCLACYRRFPWEGPMGEGAKCPLCGEAGLVRPDIVWFGEMPYQMERIEEALRGCDLFVSIGTSGAVYPAAGFVQTARHCSARTLEMNLEPSLGSIFFNESRTGSAGELVPAWVEVVLAAV